MLVQKGTQLEPKLGVPYMTDLAVRPNHMEFNYLQVLHFSVGELLLSLDFLGVRISPLSG